MLPMLVPMLTNVIGGLVADTASNLAKEHVMDMVDKVIPPEAKEAIDAVVSADPTNPCGSMTELIERIADPLDDSVPSMPAMPDMGDVASAAGGMMGAVADMVGPIEMQVKLSFDPKTMDVNIEKV